MKAQQTESKMNERPDLFFQERENSIMMNISFGGITSISADDARYLLDRIAQLMQERDDLWFQKDQLNREISDALHLLDAERTRNQQNNKDQQMTTETPIILVQSVDYDQNWQTITADDLDAIQHIDTMFDSFFSRHHAVFSLNTYVEFSEWIEDYGYDGYTAGEFDNFIREDFDFLHSPEVNNQMISQLNDWFARYHNETEQSEEIITLNGKRYKLID
jgi:hypothetical protein